MLLSGLSSAFSFALMLSACAHVWHYSENKFESVNHLYRWP